MPRDGVAHFGPQDGFRTILICYLFRAHVHDVFLVLLLDSSNLNKYMYFEVVQNGLFFF